MTELTIKHEESIRKAAITAVSGAAGPAIAKDALADLIFSLLLDREDELGAEAEAGLPRQEELAVVRALLRLILSPSVRMPLSRLQ
jgi:hypothetical protein